MNRNRRTAIVTGASRNLGRAFAHMLARQGIDVLVHFNAPSSQADAEETARLVRAEGAEAELAQADLTDRAAAASLIDTAVARFGQLDVLINSAGVIVKKPFAEISDAEFDHSFAVNARAPFILMRGAASHMQEGGSIINVATSVLACSFPFYAVYAGSKAPLEQFTRALAKELASRRINVNTIAPGALDTPFFYGAETDESVAAIKQFTGGLGHPEDVVPTVEFLITPGARWLTGQTMFVNGGFATR